MKEKILVSKVKVYHTEEDGPNGYYWKVGVSVANRLNGNAHLVGTYVAGRDSSGIKSGFLTAREQFSKRKHAEEKAKLLRKEFPAASQLDPREWSWGECLDSDLNYYEVRYKDTVVSEDSEPEEAEEPAETKTRRGKGNTITT